MGANTGRGDWPIRSVWVGRQPTPLRIPIYNRATVSGVAPAMNDWFFDAPFVPPPAGSSVYVPLRTMMGMGL